MAKAFSQKKTDMILKDLKASATMRGLFLTVSHREDIGSLYPQVLEILVYGACQRLFPE